MASQDTPTPVPAPDDQPKAKEQVIDPWNVSGEVAEDGSVKPIGMRPAPAFGCDQLTGQTT
jgi:hypothetical protein